MQWIEFSGTVDYSKKLQFEDLGNMAIHAWNERKDYHYYIIIRTQLGITSIAVCGPMVPDKVLLPDGFSQYLKKIDYSEETIRITLSKILNGKSHITDAEIVTFEEAISKVRNFQWYLENFGEDIY